MELMTFAYCLLVLFACYLGFKMGKGEPLLELPRKMGKSVKTEAQQAEIEKKLTETKDIRRAVNG